MKTTFQKFSAEYPKPYRAADYLEKNIAAEAMVETFESELLFLAPDINFHYPTDLVSMQLFRKWCIDPQLKIDYELKGPTKLHCGWLIC